MFKLAQGDEERGTKMAAISKGRSPFYPGQPVPVELFVGRREQINRILERGAGQVSLGKQVAIFVEGEYGIGKSSLAGFVQYVAEKDYGLHGIYAPLGGAGNLTEMAAAILESTLRSGAFDPRRSEKVRELLAKYIGKQELFGISINLDALRKDAPAFSTPFGLLGFLQQVLERLKDDGVRGIVLILDEINGIANNPDFAHFIKGLVDTNAMSRNPIPLLLMLCGVEQRRREMIKKHQPIERIFDIIEIQPMSKDEMKEFFSKAFKSVQIKINDENLNVLTYYPTLFIACTSAYDFALRTVNNTTIRQATRSSASG
jgi:hypothetical protein